MELDEEKLWKLGRETLEQTIGNIIDSGQGHEGKQYFRKMALAAYSGWIGTGRNHSQGDKLWVCICERIKPSPPLTTCDFLVTCSIESRAQEVYFDMEDIHKFVCGCVCACVHISWKDT